MCPRMGVTRAAIAAASSIKYVAAVAAVGSSGSGSSDAVTAGRAPNNVYIDCKHVKLASITSDKPHYQN